MGMTIEEIIKKEKEIAAEFQKAVDTHIVNDNGDTIEEMCCDDTEVIEEHLQRCKVFADYHNQIVNTMCKYQKIVDIVSLNGEEFKQCGLKELKEILEVIADGNDD